MLFIQPSVHQGLPVKMWVRTIKKMFWNIYFSICWYITVQWDDNYKSREGIRYHCWKFNHLRIANFGNYCSREHLHIVQYTEPATGPWMLWRAEKSSERKPECFLTDSVQKCTCGEFPLFLNTIPVPSLRHVLSRNISSNRKGMNFIKREKKRKKTQPKFHHTVLL